MGLPWADWLLGRHDLLNRRSGRESSERRDWEGASKAMKVAKRTRKGQPDKTNCMSDEAFGHLKELWRMLSLLSAQSGATYA